MFPLRLGARAKSLWKPHSQNFMPKFENSLPFFDVLMIWKESAGMSKIAVWKTPFSPGKLRWEEIWDCQGLSKKEGMLPDIVRRRKGCAGDDVPAPPSRAAAKC